MATSRLTFPFIECPFVAGCDGCANIDPLPPTVNCDTFGDATFVAFRDGE